MLTLQPSPTRSFKTNLGRCNERADMIVHLRDLKQTIRTMLIVDHDVGFISAVSDHLYAIAYGKPLTHGTPEHVLKHPEVIAAYMG